MRKRIIYGSGLLLLAILVTLIVWQGSFSFGDFGPSSPQQTYTLWAVSTVIFILTVTLGFMLVRNFVKLYVERQTNREGSRIRTKLVVGALALSSIPVVFLVIFSVSILNVNLNRWFGRPAEIIKTSYSAIGASIATQVQAKAQAQARWLASQAVIQQAAQAWADPPGNTVQTICGSNEIEELMLWRPDGTSLRLCAPPAQKGPNAGEGVITIQEPIGEATMLVLRSRMPLDLEQTQRQVAESVRQYDQLAADRKTTRFSYLQLLALITLFILFFATWIALFMAKQISVPISALLDAAQQVRGGNLAYRVRVGAIDELASLVRAFNEMTRDLDANSRELEDRRRFTEAILESIPTGVLSLTSDGIIQKVNRALKGIFPADQVDKATRIEHLFSREDTREIRYLMNRARRMGIAASQFELKTQSKVLHLSATVAALDDRVNSGFVLVLEDTSDLLRAQKSAAWNEVARRIAHEIKNPLTPIALCAERIVRHLDRASVANPETERILRQCSTTISNEVETVKTLVDEFSQFARFPSAQPMPADLNEVVESALGVFDGRLAGIEVRTDLARVLPLVNIDREQFRRLVVNLVDNAAEAMQESLVKQLYIGTAGTADTVELVVADTGCGVSPEDKEKLFLPYFSTKGRGTGLGLAIVNHILVEHNAHIRVEDNPPQGARFTVELAAVSAGEPDHRSLETRA